MGRVTRVVLVLLFTADAGFAVWTATLRGPDGVAAEFLNSDAPAAEPEPPSDGRDRFAGLESRRVHGRSEARLSIQVETGRAFQRAHEKAALACTVGKWLAVANCAFLLFVAVLLRCAASAAKRGKTGAEESASGGPSPSPRTPNT